MLKLPDELRAELSKPQGELVSGDEAARAAARTKAGGKPVISVGDRVTYELLSRQVVPDVAIIDGKEMREPVDIVDKSAFRCAFNVVNERGTLNLEAVNVVRSALQRAPSIVIVEGEEDLLGIAAVLAAPNGALVIYGQPSVGVVAIRVSEEKREKFAEFVKRMEPLRNNSTKNL